MNIRRTSTAGALAALVLVASLTLSGCGAISGFFGGAVRDDETGEISEGGEIDVFSIAVGDCLASAPDGEVQSVQVVPCSDEHEGEVFHDFELPDGDFPGDEAIETAAYEGCDPAFEEFVGLTYDESTLDYSYYAPTTESWAEGDRLISCIISDPAGTVTGSLSGAAR